LLKAFDKHGLPVSQMLREGLTNLRNP
jgi:hypothetical protein